MRPRATPRLAPVRPPRTPRAGPQHVLVGCADTGGGDHPAPPPPPPPAPAVTPSPKPSTRPPTTKPAPALTVQIVSLAPTGQGTFATATAHTAPAANCSIDVDYKSGPASAAGLDPKTASAAGAVRWTWKVGTRTTPGDWPVTVTCTHRSASESDQRFLTVLDTGEAG